MWPPHSGSMMTSSNGNIFRVTGHLCGEFTGPQWIHKGQWRRTLVFSLICARINDWVNNREAGDLRRHRTHYDVIVMTVTEENDGKKWRFLKFDRFAGSKQLCNNIVYSSVGYISLDNPLVSSKIFQECWWQTLILVSEQTACMCCSPFKADELYICVSKLDHHWFR